MDFIDQKTNFNCFQYLLFEFKLLSISTLSIYTLWKTDYLNSEAVLKNSSQWSRSNSKLLCNVNTWIKNRIRWFFRRNLGLRHFRGEHIQSQTLSCAEHCSANVSVFALNRSFRQFVFSSARRNLLRIISLIWFYSMTGSESVHKIIWDSQWRFGSELSKSLKKSWIDWFESCLLIEYSLIRHFGWRTSSWCQPRHRPNGARRFGRTLPRQRKRSPRGESWKQPLLPPSWLGRFSKLQFWSLSEMKSREVPTN